MGNRRWKDYQWDIATTDGRRYESTNQAQHLAVLMDIRDELKALNLLLHCQNFQNIPFKLDAIARNTKKKRKRAVGKPKLRVVR